MTGYDKIELTDEELKAAILEGKKKKYFHDKNKEHWQKLKKEKKNAKTYKKLS